MEQLIRYDTTEGKKYYIIPHNLRRFLLKMVHIELEAAAARAHDKSLSEREREIAHEAVQAFLDAHAMLTYAEGGVCVDPAFPVWWLSFSLT